MKERVVDEFGKAQSNREGAQGASVPECEITEEAILQKKKELFSNRWRDGVVELDCVEEVKAYLSHTENKLVYQEQFLEICNKVFGIDYATADYYRLEIAKMHLKNLQPLKEIIVQKFPDDAEKLFDYFCKTVIYAVKKSYVIDCLKGKIAE